MEKMILTLVSIASAIPAIFFFILIGMSDPRGWNCENNGLIILAATVFAAIVISASIAAWLKISPHYSPAKLSMLLLPWLIFVVPVLLIIFAGPQCDLASIRKEAKADNGRMAN
ncbi:hypothetical protein [Sphingomonas crocodyli]|uniref:Uncharacterized protein n=1 Tax=Sphingomonas crocodyli TaxID=1979270 RepID=A0A437M6B6_9SPHN|nr:hypothetical protein [Sphingomonas crocodyli]RVT93189.1 hypothetical protein EOD43_04695 [Sphingomonas crocodyli]